MRKRNKVFIPFFVRKRKSLKRINWDLFSKTSEGRRLIDIRNCYSDNMGHRKVIDKLNKEIESYYDRVIMANNNELKEE